MAATKENEISELYRQRDSFILLGLTGRTGSGCSTVAGILSRKKFSDLDLRSYKTCGYLNSEERKYSLIYRFMHLDRRWQPFTVIEASSVIFSFVLDGSFKELFDFLDSLVSDGCKFDNLEEVKIKLIEGLIKKDEWLKHKRFIETGIKEEAARSEKKDSLPVKAPSESKEKTSPETKEKNSPEYKERCRQVIDEYKDKTTPIISKLSDLCSKVKGSDLDDRLYNYYYEKYERPVKDNIELIIKYFTDKNDDSQKEPDSVLDFKNKVASLLEAHSITYPLPDEKKKEKNNTASVERNKKRPEMTASLYSYFMQTIGNNLRAHGCYYLNDDNKKTQKVAQSAAQRSLHTNLPIRRIDSIIRLIKYSEFQQSKLREQENHTAISTKNNEQKTLNSSEVQLDHQRTRICIDALRNSVEIEYLRDRYTNFYTLAISAEDNERQRRLLAKNLKQEQIRSLDKIEYPHENTNFYHQNIQACLQIADIHVHNPYSANQRNFELTEQLVKYIALILQPGLVTPSHLERCMQLAFNAKFNSGCLSRQVGAVITGDDYSVRAVGWNDVPKGQTPCNLRCVEDYCRNKDPDTFSEYELTDLEFDRALYNIYEKIQEDRANYKTRMSGKCFAFCFKDIYNTIKQKDNQVYTRSLHAEENAFLQIAKYGGAPIEGGKLFTTASPCELCAKKAYQLGIREIYYIDPYPGISKSHILTFGLPSNPLNPRMIFFHGAIGNAYLQLYSPRLPLKDEISLASGLYPKILARPPEKKDAQETENNIASAAEATQSSPSDSRTESDDGGKDSMAKPS